MCRRIAEEDIFPLALKDAVKHPVTPLAPALPAFTDDNTQTDALTVTAGAYKIVFLAFPFEEFGTAAQKTSLMTSVFSYFNAP